MNRYKLFAMRLGLRAVSAIFSFIRILIVFSFGISAITTIIVDNAHILTNVQMNQIWQENQVLILTSIALAIGADMGLNWLRSQIIFQSPRISNALHAISFKKPEMVNLHETRQ